MWKSVVVLISLALIGNHVFQLIKHMEYHKHVFNHRPGPCRLIEGIERGSEDIQALPSGLTFISSGLNFGSNVKHPYFINTRGRIMTFDFNEPDKPPKELEIDGEIDKSALNPHGLSIWSSPTTGVVYLFLVNHANDEETVEKFQFESSNHTLRHLKTYRDESFWLLNDIVATGENSFYVTNTAYYKHFLLKLTTYLLMKTGNIVFHDGSTYRQVAAGFIHANGVNLSPDKRFLYLAEPLDSKLHVFQRNTDNSLTHMFAHHLNTRPDNIDVDTETGDLWLGCHPVLHRVMEHLDNPSIDAPSQVLKLTMQDGNITGITEVLADDGKLIQGSTVAVYHRDALLVGTVYRGMLYCKLHSL